MPSPTFNRTSSSDPAATGVSTKTPPPNEKPAAPRLNKGCSRELLVMPMLLLAIAGCTRSNAGVEDAKQRFDWYFNAATRARERKDLQGSADNLQLAALEAERIDSTDPKLLYCLNQLGKTHLLAKKHEEALKCFTGSARLAELSLTNANGAKKQLVTTELLTARLGQGETWLDKGDYTQAEQAFAAIIKTIEPDERTAEDPGQLELLHLRCLCGMCQTKLNQHRLDAAIMLADQMIAYQQKTYAPKPLIRRVKNILRLLCKEEQRVPELETRELQKDFLAGRYALLDKDHASAEKLLTNALRSADSNEERLRCIDSLSLLYYQSGQLSKARALTKQVLTQAKPGKDAGLLLRHAKLSQFNNELAQAAAIYQLIGKSDAVWQDRLAALDNLAEMQDAMGDTVSAEGSWQQCVNLRVENRVSASQLLPCWLDLANDQWLNGKFKEAIKTNREILALQNRIHEPPSQLIGTLIRLCKCFISLKELKLAASVNSQILQLLRSSQQSNGLQTSRGAYEWATYLQKHGLLELSVDMACAAADARRAALEGRRINGALPSIASGQAIDSVEYNMRTTALTTLTMLHRFADVEPRAAALLALPVRGRQRLRVLREMCIAQYRTGNLNGLADSLKQVIDNINDDKSLTSRDKYHMLASPVTFSMKLKDLTLARELVGIVTSIKADTVGLEIWKLNKHLALNDAQHHNEEVVKDVKAIERLIPEIDFSTLSADDKKFVENGINHVADYYKYAGASSKNYYYEKMLAAHKMKRWGT